MKLQEKYDWAAIQRDYDTGMTVRQVAAKYGMNKGHFDSAKIQIPEGNRQIRVGGYMVDGIDRENRIIYEFDGDYWHGNPKVFNPYATNKNAGKKFWQLHLKTLSKKSSLEDMGYEVINIWESELPLFEAEINL